MPVTAMTRASAGLAGGLLLGASARAMSPADKCESSTLKTWLSIAGALLLSNLALGVALGAPTATPTVRPTGTSTPTWTPTSLTPTRTPTLTPVP